MLEASATTRSSRESRLRRQAELEQHVRPLKAEHLLHQATIHRLKFEEVVAGGADAARTTREAAEAEAAELQSRIEPLAKEINQLTRQLWVTKDAIVKNNYDLSVARYRHVEHDDVFHEQPAVTLEQLRLLEEALLRDVTRLTDEVL